MSENNLPGEREMSHKNTIKLFRNKKIRAVWNEDEQDYYFSIIDIIAVLSESPHPRNYWSKLKTKLKKEGSELCQKWAQLKMPATDGKMRLTDVLNTKGVLRLV